MIDEDAYNALAASRKYVWDAVARARSKRWPAGPADRSTSVEQAVAAAEADLAKIDAIIDREDRSLLVEPAAKEIWVVAHNGYTEGHGLPYLAFADRETAHRWVKAQPEPYSVARVPIYPEIPEGEWFRLEPDVFHVKPKKEGRPMRLTEEEAKSKWCPFARIIVEPDVGDARVAGNRWMGEQAPTNSPTNSECLGSGCMAWRWGTQLLTEKIAIQDRTRGYCGLAGQPE